MVSSLSQVITREVLVRGYGVHSGQSAGLKLGPASEEEGIFFVREDLPGQPRIKANLNSVHSTDRGTTLIGESGALVLTVEHLLSALAGLGVARARIGIDGKELPIGDGSALTFTRALTDVLKPDDSGPEPLSLREPVWIQEGESLLAAFPHPDFWIEAGITMDSLTFPGQCISVQVTPSSYISQLAPARTFGYLAEALPLIERGLAAGSGLDNTVVIADDAIYSQSGLRFPDEFVRHKILDLLGDLSLLGRPLNARIFAIRPGHKLNVALARKIMEAVNE